MEKEIIKQSKKINKQVVKYRCILCVVLVFACLALGGLGYAYYDRQLPEVLRFKAGEQQILNLHLPMTAEVVAVSEGGTSNIPGEAITIDLGKTVVLDIFENQDYLMDVKLFGWIPFKQVDIRVIGEMELTPVGIPVGLYVETEGLLVVGVGEFEDESGTKQSPSKYILKSGDYILEYNGKPATDKDEFIRDVEKSKGKDINLKISRNGQIQNVSVKPEKNNAGKYKIGIWVRDNAQGVGTMTYVDGKGRFGALGHGVTDVDTSMLMDVEGGTLYRTEIVSIQKGQSGTPGEMTGMIVYSDNYVLGEIDFNGEEGIFGICNERALEMCCEKPLPVGLKQEIEKGPAYIYCAVKEGAPEYYEVEITAVHLDHDNINRGIELRVTDNNLLNMTGGIVQGMSGSPIIQNGRIIGAVTHVLVNDPTRGYGIFIENMLEH